MNDTQKHAGPRLEVGPQKCDGKSVCEILLDGRTVERLAELQKVLEMFFRGAECGMFRPDSNSSLRPIFRLVEHNLNPDQNRASWRYEGIHVSYAAYRVLINLLRQMPSGFASNLLVRINAEAGQECRQAGLVALSAFTQPRASQLPFNLEDDVSEPPKKQTVVMIYTLDELREDAKVRVTNALDAWADIVMAGGFNNDSGKGEVRLIKHYQTGPQSIECSIFGSEFSFGVLNSLINVLVLMHETIVKLESVEMD